MSFDLAKSNPIVTTVFKFEICADLDGEEKMFEREKALAEQWQKYVDESNKPFDMLMVGRQLGILWNVANLRIGAEYYQCWSIPLWL